MSETYARPPYASDGCVVLANPDLEMIYKLANNGAMPIVVVDKVEWVQAEVVVKSQKTLFEALDQWRIAFEKADDKAIAKAYSTNFKGDENGKKSAANKPSKIVLSNLVTIEYPGETDMVLMRFEQSSNQSAAIRKQLYWKKESGNWKIILENTL
jgi:hypothetical protein